MMVFRKNVDKRMSAVRIGAKTLFLILSWYYIDRNYIRVGSSTIRTPQSISRLNNSHITLPIIDIPPRSETERFEEFSEFKERLREAWSANQFRYYLKYQDNPLLENGRLVDEYLFDSEYIRIRDLSRFNAMKQMVAVGLNNPRNENEVLSRKESFKKLKARVKPVVD